MSTCNKKKEQLDVEISPFEELKDLIMVEFPKVRQYIKNVGLQLEDIEKRLTGIEAVNTILQTDVGDLKHKVRQVDSTSIKVTNKCD